MITRGFAVLALVVAFATAAGASNDDAEKQCYASAINSFIAQKQRLLSVIPVPVGSRIAIRRLEEQFCSQTTQCATASMAKDAISLAASAIFDRCLQNEAKEVYDLVPRR
ncbi:hypothetical protein F4V91_07400 [Neorhizobium galegae]|uniref:UrcA family protein n=1 Tax=Neorhizobium galegae TaxID=399 RepID=A0A6A1TPY7_NEOGA|nr:hypothetical protein [Neorhizobium galegae]KAB1086276.1 hypothetical protein F4V91_07400 [Neorhizobium galegae]